MGKITKRSRVHIDHISDEFRFNVAAALNRCAFDTTMTALETRLVGLAAILNNKKRKFITLDQYEQIQRALTKNYAGLKKEFEQKVITRGQFKAIFKELGT